MPPPRGSAAGGNASPVLHSDGSLNPSDSGYGSYSSCGLQLQGSSQPLQGDQLGLPPLAPSQQLGWMRSSSSGGGGRDPARPQTLSRLGSMVQGDQLLPIGSLAGSGQAVGGSEVLPLRCSDSSCTGTPMLVHTNSAAAAHHLLQAPMLCGNAAAAAGAALPLLPLVPGGSAGGAADAAGFGEDGAARLPSAPSRGLSGLLCWEGAQDAGGGEASLGISTAPSQELLLEAFRDMQEGDDQPLCAGTAPAARRQVQVPHLQVGSLLREEGEEWSGAQAATPGSKRDRAADCCPEFSFVVDEGAAALQKRAKAEFW
jgi:hypothetical protein